MEVVYSRRARRDIEDIHDRIADVNPIAAERVVSSIIAKCDRLAFFPGSANRTDEPQVYRLPVVHYRYTIFYRVTSDQDLVEIVRIVHSSRVKNLRHIPR